MNIEHSKETTTQYIKDQIIKLEQAKEEIDDRLKVLYGLDFLEWLKENKEKVTVYYNFAYFVIPHYIGCPSPPYGLAYIENTALSYDFDDEEWTCYVTNSAIDDFVKFGLKIDFDNCWNASELEKYYKKKINENSNSM